MLRHSLKNVSVGHITKYELVPDPDGEWVKYVPPNELEGAIEVSYRHLEKSYRELWRKYQMMRVDCEKLKDVLVEANGK